jgi:zeaxanthin glucosyltransferase
VTGSAPLGGTRSNERRLVTIVVCRAQGHLNASFGLAHRLRDLGKDVRFVGPSEIERLVSGAGFPFTQLRSLDVIRMPFGIARRPAELFSTDTLHEFRRLVTLGREELRRFRAQFHEIRDEVMGLVRTAQPQLFLFDPFYLMFALPLIADGHPVRVLSTKPLASFGARVPPYTTHFLPRGFSFPICNLFIWYLQRLKYACWELWETLVAGSTYRRLVEEFGAFCGVTVRRIWNTRPILFDTCFSNCPEWVLHSPAFDFPREGGRPGAAYYVGPCIYRARVEQAEETPPGNGPLIFVAFSTVRHKSRVPLRRKLIQAFLQVARSRPTWRIVMAVGEQVHEIDRSALPRNTRVVEFAPSMQMLSKADVLVCQAGANFVKEAIWLGVPMLLFPDRADQPGNAARVAHHGLGISRRRLPTTETLCTDLENLINSWEVAARLSAMRRKFEEDDANDRLLQEALSSVD